MNQSIVESRFIKNWDNSRKIIQGRKSWRCAVCNREQKLARIRNSMPYTEKELYISYRTHYMTRPCDAEETDMLRRRFKLESQYGSMLEQKALI